MKFTLQSGLGSVTSEDGSVIRRALKARLEQAQDKGIAGVTAILREEATEVQLLAKDYAAYADPSQGGREGRHLVDAIEVKEEKQSGRRVAFTVFVNGRRSGHNGETVGSYAHAVHEGMEPEGTGEINRGLGTQLKGPEAGGKFLERALRDSEKRIARRVAAAGKTAFRKGRL